MKQSMPNTNAKPAVISAPEKKGSLAASPSSDTGHKAGAPVKGFSGGGLLPSKV